MKGIYVTGNIVADCLLRPVDKMPAWGTTTYVDSISMRMGGNGAAAAYAAAMMGVPTRLAGAVGDDPFGDFVRSRLQTAGVDLSALRVLEGVSTATTVGLIHSSGERLFLHDPGASSKLSPDDVLFDAESVAGCGVFHYASIFCLPAMRRRSLELLEGARNAGLTISLDTDWDTEGRWMEEFAPLCPLIDYLFVNQQEGKMLTGSAEPELIARFFQERGVGNVVVKMGPRGCEVFAADERFASPAYAVEAVDTTGAGDCFCGGFLAGICRGFSLHDAARLANAVAGHCVREMGTTDGLVGYEATRHWMTDGMTDARARTVED